jgi:hypothetical protein
MPILWLHSGYIGNPATTVSRTCTKLDQGDFERSGQYLPELSRYGFIVGVTHEKFVKCTSPLNQVGQNVRRHLLVR